MGLTENKIRKLMSDYPQVLFGFTDISYSEYGEEYKSAMIIAIPFGGQLTMEEYTEELFDKGIIDARNVEEELLPKIAGILEEQGIKYWIPPMAQQNETELRALFSCKLAAVHAGMGWFGKNDVIITEKYGPRIRLAAILIDDTYEYGEEITESRCSDDCTKCIDACPCKALKNRKWSKGISRDELIDYHKCNKMRSAFIKKLGRKSACGLCLTACPFGRGE